MWQSIVISFYLLEFDYKIIWSAVMTEYNNSNRRPVRKMRIYNDKGDNVTKRRFGDILLSQIAQRYEVSPIFQKFCTLSKFQPKKVEFHYTKESTF